MPLLSASSSDGEQTSEEPVVMLAFMQAAIRARAYYCRMGVQKENFEAQRSKMGRNVGFSRPKRCAVA
jgi:hypothetical protein